jgi:putative DNA primase/helicase
VVQEFAAAMLGAGLLPGDGIVADGEVHAFHVEGDRRYTKNGRYALYADARPAGWFGTHKQGVWHRWAAACTLDPTPAEHAAHAHRIAVLKAARDAERQAAQDAASKRAADLWRRSRPATGDHPYLMHKRVRAYGIRALRQQLVIPVRDVAGLLWSLQFVSPDGAKTFLTGGRTRGCYYALGRPAGVLCICEGYATAASIFEATEYATAVAFSAGNLEPVALALRAKFPDTRIVLCADNDVGTPGNPGLTAATRAAAIVRGAVAVPSFEERSVLC